MEDDVIDVVEGGLIVNEVIHKDDPFEEEESEGGGDLTHTTQSSEDGSMGNVAAGY